MQRRGFTRAFAIAVLAAGLSFAGPGAFALASDAGRLTPATGKGRDAPPFVARLDASPARVALPAARLLLAVLAGGAPRLLAPTCRSFETARPARHAQGRPTDFVRTSRGPPLG